VLAPDNLALLYLGFAIIKTIHEFGHAFMCRRFGGEVHTMGIMFMIFTPIPYVDATSAWAFRSRWQRILVGLGGMIPEIFVAALMTFVWANTGAGTLHNLAYNMMFVASVSTVVFNANPLMRFDGYYILSDLLSIPNLNMRGYRQLGYLAERYLFGRENAESPAHSRREAWWLATFAIAASIYRTVVFGVLLFFLFGQYLILGVIMATVCGIAWLVIPVVRFVQYLASSPRIDRHRPRAIAVTVGILGALLIVLDVIPFPNRFRAPGVLQAVEHTLVANPAPGYIESILASPGSLVKRGDPLVKLFDNELAYQLAGARAQLVEAEAMELRALQEQTADLLPVRSRIEAVRKQVLRLEEQERQLTVTAPHEGKWIAPDLANISGARLARGTPLGHLVDEREFRFLAVVSQQEAAQLFGEQIRVAEVRIFGQADLVLPVTERKIIPAERTSLPSPALGWVGGGEVPVQLNDSSGVRAAEPFFELRATIRPQPGIAILTGRSGKIRFELPPQPLLQQWVRQFRQLLQKHYGV
jgi:putative peptide zinc metalloprotease protein